MSKNTKKELEQRAEEKARQSASELLRASPRYGLYKVLRDATSYFSDFVDEQVDKASLVFHAEGDHCAGCCDATFDKDPMGDCGGCQGYMVRYTAVGAQDFFRDISVACDFCVDHQDAAALDDIGCSRRHGAVEDAVYLADQLKHDAVAACTTKKHESVVAGLMDDWRSECGEIKKASILWVARLGGATPEEAAAVNLLMPWLESGEPDDLWWWDEEALGLLSLAESWDDFSEPSAEVLERYQKSLEMPTNQEINDYREAVRAEEHHCEATHKQRNQKEW